MAEDPLGQTPGKGYLGVFTLKMTATAVYGRGESQNLERNMSSSSLCCVNVQSSLHENVVFSVFASMDNAAYIIFIMWNSISRLEPWLHFRFNISCGVAVTVRSHQEKIQVIFQGDMRGAKKNKKILEGRANFHF